MYFANVLGPLTTSSGLTANQSTVLPDSLYLKKDLLSEDFLVLTAAVPGYAEAVQALQGGLRVTETFPSPVICHPSAYKQTRCDTHLTHPRSVGSV